MLATQEDKQEDKQDLPQERSPAPQSASRRDLTFDILKGIGILEVMIHHLLAYSTRKFTVPGAPEWWAFLLTNRVLHFAVPTFLLASALLLARSMASKPRPDWRRYAERRVQRSLAPYLVWSLIYIAFRLVVLKPGSDVVSVTSHVPLFGTITGPALLVDGSQWVRNLVWGKAYYHLYFMSVLLQFAALFPLLFVFMRRVPLGFGPLAALSLALQAGVFWLQAHVFFPKLGFTTPASMALWYLPALLIGMWLGLNWKRWPEVWRENRVHIACGTALAFVLYFYLSIRILQKEPVSSFAFNAGATIYATGMALLLLAGAARLAAVPRWGAILARIGDRSLPLFLIHPMVLYFMGGPKIARFLDALPLTPLWAGLILFALTWAAIDLTRLLKIDGYLFGRRFSAPESG